MAAERLRVWDVRKVLKLCFVDNKSQSQIALSLGCGKTTVREYLHRAKSANLVNHDEIQKLSDDDLMTRLGFKRLGEIGKVPLRRSEFSMPDWVQVQGELAKPGVTLALLWTEYREIHGASSYSYTQFCEHYKRWSRKLSVVMRQNHKAGEKCFVDYCEGLWWIQRPASVVAHSFLWAALGQALILLPRRQTHKPFQTESRLIARCGRSSAGLLR